MFESESEDGKGVIVREVEVCMRFVDRLGGASCENEMTRWWGKTPDGRGRSEEVGASHCEGNEPSQNRSREGASSSYYIVDALTKNMSSWSLDGLCNQSCRDL